MFIDDIEKSTNITFCFYAVNRWMGTWLDHICILLNLAVIIFAVSQKGVYSTELLAFTFQAVSDVIVWYSYFMRQAADIENYLTAT